MYPAPAGDILLFCGIRHRCNHWTGECRTLAPASDPVLPSDLKLSDFQTEVHLNVESVQAPVTAGQVLGSLTLRYQGKELGTVDLVAVYNVERSEILYTIDQLQIFLKESGTKLAAGLAILVAGIILLRLPFLRFPQPLQLREPPPPATATAAELYSCRRRNIIKFVPIRFCIPGAGNLACVPAPCGGGNTKKNWD